MRTLLRSNETRRAILETLAQVLTDDQTVSLHLVPDIALAESYDTLIRVTTREVPNHVLPQVAGETWDLMIQHALTIHEAAHILFTSRDERMMTATAPPLLQCVLKTIEEGRIERLIGQRRPATARVLRLLRTNFGAWRRSMVRFQLPWTDSSLLAATLHHIHDTTVHDTDIFRSAIEHGVQLEPGMADLLRALEGPLNTALDENPAVSLRAKMEVWKQLQARFHHEAPPEWMVRPEGCPSPETGAATPSEKLVMDADDALETTVVALALQEDPYLQTLQAYDMRVQAVESHPERYETIREAVEERGRSLGTVLKRLLPQRRAASVERGRRRGHLDVKRLHRTSLGDNRVFVQRTGPTAPEYEFSVLVDRSASMSESIYGAERATAVATYGLDLAQVPTEVMGYNSYGLYLHKAPGEPFATARWRLATGATSGTTPTHLAIQAARERVQQAGKVPVILVITDGVPDDVSSVMNEVAACHFPVLGLVLGTEDADEWGFTSHVNVPNPDDLGDRLEELIEQWALTGEML